MDQITLRNFRCFREEQTARLAPLTLLVGENSTGKTSFMAMIRALWDTASLDGVPDFKEEPYDLGSFDEIAHYRGGPSSRATTFEAGFNVAQKATRGKRRRVGANGQPYSFEVTFQKRGTVPGPVKIRFSHENVWIEIHLEDESWQTSFGTPRGSWKFSTNFPDRLDANFNPTIYFLFVKSRGMIEDRESKAEPITSQYSGAPADEDWELIEQLTDAYVGREFHRVQPYASAPVRSKPRRTYDPSRTTRDPEGNYVPMYLASVYFQNENRWKILKGALEHFGQVAGLFDEILVKPLGSEGGPFQVQVRKFGDRGNRSKGPQRNLIDVGYGVSQVLPVITELLRPDAPSMFLLQQPEVHLHPSAQAALGSLFCQVAKPERQLVVETHSDHLIDRVRMDVRDERPSLRPEDVSILFFERGDLDVRIHSLRVDQEGNVLDAPESYRRFFLQETQRSLGL